MDFFKVCSLTGTIVGGCYVALCFICTMGTGSHDSNPHWAVITTLWFLGVLAGLLSGWLRYRWPRHPVISVTAVTTIPVLMGTGISQGNPLHRCFWRAVCFACGVVLSGCVTRWFLPRKARTDIIEALIRIINELASALEPLLELESGLIVSNSFFEPSGGYPKVNIGAWQAFKKQIWAQLENCGRQISGQLAMMNAAKREVSWRQTEGFQAETYKNCLLRTRTVFYHVTSLFTLIERQMDHSPSLSHRGLQEVSVSKRTRSPHAPGRRPRTAPLCPLLFAARASTPPVPFDPPPLAHTHDLSEVSLLGGNELV